MAKPKPNVLYRFFNSGGELLYVGITGDIGSRWKSHATDKDWYTEIVSATLEHFPNEFTLARAEKQAIKAERPRYNLAMNSGWGRIPIWGTDGKQFYLSPAEIDRYDHLAGLSHLEQACTKCQGYQVCRPVDADGDPLNDLVHCISCLATWTTSAWELEVRLAMEDVA